MAPAVLIQDWPSDLPLRRQTEAQRRRFRLACDLPSKPVKGWGPATLVHLETALSIWRLAPIWRPLVHSKIWGATLSIFISRVGQTGLVWIVSARLSPPRNGETHLPLILRIFWVSPPRLRGYRIRSSRQRSQRLHLGCHGTGEANDPVNVLGCVPRHSTTVPAVDELSLSPRLDQGNQAARAKGSARWRLLANRVLSQFFLRAFTLPTASPIVHRRGLDYLSRGGRGKEGEGQERGNLLQER